MSRSSHPAAVRDGGSEQPEWREKEDTESLTSDDEGWTPLPSELHPPLALEVEKLFRRRAHHHRPASSSSSSSSNNETYDKSQPTPREGDETEQKPAAETPPISGGKHRDRSFGNVYRELPVIDHPPLVLPSNWLEDSPTTDHPGGDELLAVDDGKSDDDMADFTVTFRRSGSTQRHASVSYHSSTPSERIYRQPRCRRMPPRRGTEEICGSSSASKTRVTHVSTRHKRERDRVQKSSRRKHQRREEPSSSRVPPDNGVLQNALLSPPPPPPPLPLPSILEEDDGCSMDWMEDDLYPEALQVEQSGS